MDFLKPRDAAAAPIVETEDSEKEKEVSETEGEGEGDTEKKKKKRIGFRDRKVSRDNVAEIST